MQLNMFCERCFAFKRNKNETFITMSWFEAAKLITNNFFLKKNFALKNFSYCYGSFFACGISNVHDCEKFSASSPFPLKKSPKYCVINWLEKFAHFKFAFIEKLEAF